MFPRADGYLRSCFETAAPLDHLSSTSCVNNDSHLFNEQLVAHVNFQILSLTMTFRLEDNTGEQQGLKSISPECGQNLCVNSFFTMAFSN